MDLKTVDLFFESKYSIYDNMVCDEFNAIILFKEKPDDLIVEEIKKFWDELVEKTKEEKELENAKILFFEKTKKRTIFSSSFIQELLFFHQEFEQYLLIKNILEYLNYNQLEAIRDELEVLFDSTNDSKYIQLFNKIQIYLSKE